jgi:hypothetical protein
MKQPPENPGRFNMAADALEDNRKGKNGWHGLVGLLRQSVYGRHTRLKLATLRPVHAQRNDLFPEVRRVRIPHSRHNRHSPSLLKNCPSNRENYKLERFYFSRRRNYGKVSVAREPMVAAS